MHPPPQTYHPHQVQEQGMGISRSQTIEHKIMIINLTWVVLILKDTPKAAVKPRAAPEAIATKTNPTCGVKT